MTESISQLKHLITKLRDQRAQLVKGIEIIDKMFAELGLSPTIAKRRRRPAGFGKAKTKRTRAVVKSAPKRKRTRRAFPQTATEFVLGLVAGKAMTSAQVNEAWKRSGRKGVANNALTALTKAGKLKRAVVKGTRGGTYTKAK